MWANPCARSLLRVVILLLAVLAQAHAASLARAQEASAGSREDYKALIKQAVQEFEAANWPEAFALFKRAHDIEPNARTLRGIGIAAYEMRDYVQSIGYLQTALGTNGVPCRLHSAGRSSV
jgi:tetratricopeptide (TPR) repeat protein